MSRDNIVDELELSKDDGDSSGDTPTSGPADKESEYHPGGNHDDSDAAEGTDSEHDSLSSHELLRAWEGPDHDKRDHDPGRDHRARPELDRFE